MARWLRLGDMSKCPHCESDIFYIGTNGAIRVFCVKCRKEMRVSIAFQSGAIKI